MDITRDFGGGHKTYTFLEWGGGGGNDFVQNISRKSSQLSPIPIHFQPSQILSAKLARLVRIESICANKSDDSCSPAAKSLILF